MGTDSTSTTKVVLDLDNSEFVGKLRESLGMLGALGEVESLEKLTTQFMKIGAVVGIATAAVLAVKVAIDFEEEAEHIKQINNTFEMLTANAGLAASVIKDELVAAAHGLASETTLLESANKAIVTMGKNAARIPEIMDDARKATKLFGGDLISNFEKMNMAMANGNVRMLRQFGLVIDADKAHKDYAKTLGVGVQYLDDAGKKQAIFNAALEQAKEKYSGVDTSTAVTTSSLKKISVSLQEIKETAALAWDALAGTAVQKLVSGFADAVHTVSVRLKESFGHGEEQAKAHKEGLEIGIQKLREMIDVNRSAWGASDIQRYTEMLKKQEAELAKINAQEERSAQLAMHKAQVAKKDSPEADGSKRGVDQEKLKADKLKFENDLLKLRQERIKAEEGMATTAVALSKLHDEEVVAAQQQANIRIKILDDDLNIKRIINAGQHSEAVKQIQRKRDADLKQIQMKRDQDEITALKNLEKQNERTAIGFRAAWAKNSAQAANDLKNFSKLGNTTFNAIGSNAVAAFTAMGDGSKSAGEAMKGFLFGTIGDVAIAQGTMHLLAGIWPPNPIELAEGAALIALGGALKSVGSSSGASAPSVSGSAASGGSGSIGQEPAKPSAPTPSASPTKHVAINIHGNLFETDQTRNRLMEMIREAGDYTDFNLKQVGQP